MHDLQKRQRRKVQAAAAYGSQRNHLHVMKVSKSEGLNTLEPSGTVRAWDGTAWLYPYNLYWWNISYR
jgi:hypothetical protein